MAVRALAKALLQPLDRFYPTAKARYMWRMKRAYLRYGQGPVLLLQMGKVGSKSVQAGLEALSGGLQIERVALDQVALGLAYLAAHSAVTLDTMLPLGFYTALMGILMFIVQKFRVSVLDFAERMGELSAQAETARTACAPSAS